MRFYTLSPIQQRQIIYQHSIPLHLALLLRLLIAVEHLLNFPLRPSDVTNSKGSRNPCLRPDFLHKLRFRIYDIAEDRPSFPFLRSSDIADCKLLMHTQGFVPHSISAKYSRIRPNTDIQSNSPGLD